MPMVGMSHLHNLLLTPLLCNRLLLTLGLLDCWLAVSLSATLCSVDHSHPQWDTWVQDSEPKTDSRVRSQLADSGGACCTVLLRWGSGSLIVK